MSKFRFRLSAIVLILGILTITTGVSYSIFSTNQSSEKTEVIKAGAVTIDYSPKNTYELNDMYELSDVEGLSQDKYYEFSLTNTGDADSKVILYLIDDTKNISDFSGVLLNKGYVRSGFEIENVEQGARNVFTKYDGAFGEDIIKIGETKNYKLRLWLDFTGLTEEGKLQLVNQQLFLKVKVIAEQYVGQ